MIWITPDTFPITYTKQRIHPSEEAYFSPLSTMQTFSIGSHRIAPAICYESTLKESIQRAYNLDADIYLVSTAKKREKLPATQEQLESFSREFGLTTLMVNFVGESGAFRSSGGSSVWSREGALLGRMEDPETGLLIYDLDKQSTAVVSQMAYQT
jgi:predicted amidohydrolase